MRIQIPKAFFLHSKYRCTRLLFMLCMIGILVWLSLSETMKTESRPKLILIKVDESLDSQFGNIFNHPWQLLLKTRRCSNPCAFISRDKLHDRPFTQNGFDHVWLEENNYNKLSRKASASISSHRDSLNSKNSINFVIQPHPNLTYAHTRSSFDVSNPIPMEILSKSKISMNSYSIGLGHGDVSYNLVSRAFRDYFEFGELARSLALNPNFPSFPARKFMVTFLPECSLLPPSHINYIIRLSKIVNLDIYGGCLELYKSKVGIKIPDFIDKMNLVGSYQYILVVEPFNDPFYVSESFFESLVYYSMPVVIGATDLTPYIPDDKGIVNARDFSDSPQRLVQYLQSISEQEWISRLNWKKMVNDRKPSFSNLWEWSIESIICRVCKISDPSSLNDSNSEIRGSIDDGKLLMYLDQRRWYKEKKKLRMSRHARHFKNGILQ